MIFSHVKYAILHVTLSPLFFHTSAFKKNIWYINKSSQSTRFYHNVEQIHNRIASILVQRMSSMMANALCKRLMFSLSWRVGKNAGFRMIQVFDSAALRVMEISGRCSC